MRQTARFRCIGDDGAIYDVIEYTHFETLRLLGGEVREVEGLKELLTAAGDAVNYKSENEFEIVVTGVKLRRI